MIQVQITYDYPVFVAGEFYGGSSKAEQICNGASHMVMGLYTESKQRVEEYDVCLTLLKKLHLKLYSRGIFSGINIHRPVTCALWVKHGEDIASIKHQLTQLLKTIDFDFSPIESDVRIVIEEEVPVIFNPESYGINRD